MKHQKQFLSYLLHRVGLQTLLLLAIVVFGYLLVRDNVARWDLTADHRFSISEASYRLAAGLEDPLTIRAYFSENLPPRLVPMRRQIFDILDEYEAHSGGKIHVERYDPLESTSAESEAKNYGVQPVQLQYYEATQASSMSVYGGIVLLYRDRASEVINIAERYPQGYEGLSILEYEISSKIWQLSHEKPKIGLCGYLTRKAMGNPMMGGGRSRPEFTGLRRILGDAADLEEVDLKQKQPDPKKMPLLIVVRPKEFSDVEVFRLDQYLVKGGRVLMFITQGTIDVGAPQPGSRQESQFSYRPFKTGLDKWLEFEGLRVPNEFVLQFQNAIPYRVWEVKRITGVGRVEGPFPEPNWFWPILGAEGSIDRDNPAMQTLKSVNLFWPHPVDILKDKLMGKTATVLLRSHKDESWRWNQIGRVDRRYLDVAGDGPKPADIRSSPLAVVLEGKFHSYFADQPVPPSLTGGDDVQKDEGGAKKEKPTGDKAGKDKQAKSDTNKKKGPAVVKESADTTQLVVIGNAIFVSDMVLGGGRDTDDRAKLAAAMAFNLVDWLARSKELIALRAKRYTDRRLIDKDSENDIKDAKKEFTAGDLSRDGFQTKLEEIRDLQKRRWKRARWSNVLLPCLLILFVGALVWIVRSARRARGSASPATVAEVEG